MSMCALLQPPPPPKKKKKKKNLGHLNVGSYDVKRLNLGQKMSFFLKHPIKNGKFSKIHKIYKLSGSSIVVENSPSI